METKVIKGEGVKERIFNEVKNELAELKTKQNKVPGIAFIGFSGNPLSKYNIPLHVQTAETTGFRVLAEIKGDDATEAELFELIDQFNQDESINAIVLLQPLPAHLNPLRVVSRIDRKKEVEGFHPMNMLSTIMPGIHEELYPMCLPTALFEIFNEAGIQFEKDKEWVFVLDDEFLSNPLTNMVVKSAAIKVVPHDCSMTMVNRKSKNVISFFRRADVLVVVTKSPGYIKASWLKKGVCIIDIYSNLLKEVPSKSDPNRLVPIIRGGIQVDSVKNIASAILPIPGGLMAVVLAILLRNALMAFKNTL